MTNINYNWRLQWPGHPVVSCHIRSRPSMGIVPRLGTDGSLVPEKGYWNLLHIALASPTPLWQNEADVFLFAIDEKGCVVERWLLNDSQNVNNDVQAVLSFESVTRIA